MSNPSSDPLHPRPQFARDRWTELCGEWEFGYDDQDVGVQEGWFGRAGALPLRIQVPFPPESIASGIGDTSFHPVVWYRRSLEVDHDPGERMLLHFGAVDYRAQVWVNGRLVVQHEGGHTPFVADITESLAADGPQVIVVRAEDQPQDEAQPRGKQDVLESPHNIWYKRTTGIWQPVWLEPVPRRRIHNARWTPDTRDGTLGVTVRFVGAQPESRVRLRLSLHGEVVADDSYLLTARAASEGLRRTVLLPETLTDIHSRKWLWSPRHPNLIQATLSLTDPDGQDVDTVHSYVGFRSVDVSKGRFRLNGRPFYLRLVLAQNYWPESHLAAPSDDALRREVELVKDLGFDGVRLHQKIEDPRFLYWCDTLGVVVWQEMPAAYQWSPVAVARTTREWLEALERDVSAPSVVAWVPMNESWGVPALQSDPSQRALVEALYWVAKAYDGSRPVVGNDGWEHVVTDIVTVHDYTQDDRALRARYGSAEGVDQALNHLEPGSRPLLLPGVLLEERPLVLSEFGGVTYRGDTDSWNGYGVAHDEEAFLDRYRALLDAVLDSPVLAGFCYTQLTDTEQEQNGLLDKNRQPKADPALLRAITQRPSSAVPADIVQGAVESSSPSRWAWYAGQPESAHAPHDHSVRSRSPGRP